MSSIRVVEFYRRERRHGLDVISAAITAVIMVLAGLQLASKLKKTKD